MAEIEDLYRGDTWPLEISVEDDQGGLEDLAGVTLWIALKADKEKPEAPLTVSHEVAGPSPVKKVVVRIGSDQTAEVPPGVYWIGVRRVRPGAPPDVFTAIDQRVTVKRAVIEDLTP